jgi:putative hydrolase of the HAD superfamily
MSSSSLPEGILFDLDDTILAFAAVADEVWKDVCSRYDEEFGTNPLYRAISEMRRWYWSDKERHKRGRQDIDRARREIVTYALNILGITDTAVAHEIADLYSAERLDAMYPFPGARETLEYLTDHDVSLALITNGPGSSQREKLERFSLERFFTTILIEGEFGCGKPEKKIYLRALSDLDLTPSEVWSVGDNLEWDIAAPQALGIYTIWNDYKKGGLPPRSTIIPDRIITAISELIEE